MNTGGAHLVAPPVFLIIGKWAKCAVSTYGMNASHIELISSDI